MPSRRAVLAGVGGLSAAGLAGGIGWSRSVGTGTLFHKSVSVLDERDGRRYVFDVATLLYAESTQEVVGTLAVPVADAYEPPATLEIGRALHERLTERFERVDYLLAFEANGRLGGRVPRADFDRVSLGDEVDVLAHDWLDIDVEASNRVVDVTPRQPPITENDVTTFPLAEAYPDDEPDGVV